MSDADGNAQAAITISAAGHEAPQAIVTIIPDATPELQETPPEAAPDTQVSQSDIEEVVVAHIDADGAVTVNLDLPIAPPQFVVTVDSPLRIALSPADAAELGRLRQRVLAEPTSFRAQQELQSFRTLKGIE